MTEQSTHDIDRNQYRAECRSCGSGRVSRVDGANSIMKDELAEIQGLYCESCDDETPHTVMEAGGDWDV